MSVQSTSQISGAKSGNKAKNTDRPVQITVKKGDTISSLAKKFGMKPEEFKKWVGLNSNTLKLGAKIDLPHDTVPDGKGIYALIKKYNMTLEEFGKLNNLPAPYNEYSAAKGEKFYVKNNKVSDSSSDSKKHTPKELADEIYKGSRKIGAVGKESFDSLIAEINSGNVEAVLKAYTKKESLINTITSEIMSKKQAREDAVMHVYDALAKAKGTPAANREEFYNELHRQLYDVWGMASTKKLDKMIEEMLDSKSARASRSGAASGVKTVDRRKVTVTNKKGVSKTYTVSELQRGAISSAKDEVYKYFKTYCKNNNIKYDKDLLDCTPIERIPAPVIKNGKVVMEESELLRPTTKPNGKVIILNAGHGGYSSRSGYFDPGSYSFIRKANGKYAPLLEYEKAKIYAESTADKLRQQGYAVVITSGHSETMADKASMRNLVKSLNNGTKGSQKYDKDDIMMISLHADSMPGATGSGVCFQPGTEDDTILKDIMLETLKQDNWIAAEEYERVWGENGVGILNQTKDIPSVLLEIEYVNGSKCKNLDSAAYQARFETQMIKAINEYFNRN